MRQGKEPKIKEGNIRATINNTEQDGQPKVMGCLVLKGTVAIHSVVGIFCHIQLDAPD